VKARGALQVPTFAALAMCAAIVGAWWLQPQESGEIPPRLQQVIPAQFGDWRQVDTALAPVDPTTDHDPGRDTNNPYDDVLMRAYSNSRGDVVLLALAYGREQHQEVKIHRPELCYVAQGFKVIKRSPHAFTIPARDTAPADGARMLVEAPGRTEAVSYWIRIGRSYSASAWATRYYIFKQGVKRRSLDGILVRVSQILDNTEAASEERYGIQEKFIADLVSAMPARARHLLVEG
jgi:EpsI family protein